MEAMCQVEIEDVVEAASKGEAQITFEWLEILLPTKVGLILDISLYWY